MLDGASHCCFKERCFNRVKHTQAIQGLYCKLMMKHFHALKLRLDVFLVSNLTSGSNTLCYIWCRSYGFGYFVFLSAKMESSLGYSLILNLRIAMAGTTTPCSTEKVLDCIVFKSSGKTKVQRTFCAFFHVVLVLAQRPHSLSYFMLLYANVLSRTHAN